MQRPYHRHLLKQASHLLYLGRTYLVTRGPFKVLGEDEEAHPFSLSARLWIIPKKHAPHWYLPRHGHARGVGPPTAVLLGHED
jgi:hypothetical protein